MGLYYINVISSVLSVILNNRAGLFKEDYDDNCEDEAR